MLTGIGEILTPMKRKVRHAKDAGVRKGWEERRMNTSLWCERSIVTPIFFPLCVSFAS